MRGLEEDVVRGAEVRASRRAWFESGVLFQSDGGDPVDVVGLGGLEGWKGVVGMEDGLWWITMLGEGSE